MRFGAKPFIWTGAVLVFSLCATNPLSSPPLPLFVSLFLSDVVALAMVDVLALELILLGCVVPVQVLEELFLEIEDGLERVTFGEVVKVEELDSFAFLFDVRLGCVSLRSICFLALMMLWLSEPEEDFDGSDLMDLF